MKHDGYAECSLPPEEHDEECYGASLDDFRWGWFFENESLACVGDYWRTLEDGITKAMSGDRLSELRFGIIEDVDFSSRTYQDPRPWLIPRVSETNTETKLYLESLESWSCGEECWERWKSFVDAAYKTKWCIGRFPLPILFSLDPDPGWPKEWQGWRESFGPRDRCAPFREQEKDSVALITVVGSKDSFRWLWWALGQFGFAQSLEEARWAAEKTLRMALKRHDGFEELSCDIAVSPVK